MDFGCFVIMLGLHLSRAKRKPADPKDKSRSTKNASGDDTDGEEPDPKRAKTHHEGSTTTTAAAAAPTKTTKGTKRRSVGQIAQRKHVKHPHVAVRSQT